jgi:hypothetical protein
MDEDAVEPGWPSRNTRHAVKIGSTCSVREIRSGRCTLQFNLIAKARRTICTHRPGCDLRAELVRIKRINLEVLGLRDGFNII